MAPFSTGWQAYKMPHDNKYESPYTAAYWDASTVDSAAPMRWIDPYPTDNEGAIYHTALLLPCNHFALKPKCLETTVP